MKIKWTKSFFGYIVETEHYKADIHIPVIQPSDLIVNYIEKNNSEIYETALYNYQGNMYSLQELIENKLDAMEVE